MSTPLDAPPDFWHKWVTDPEERRKRWSAMPNQNRGTYIARLLAAHTKVANGTADFRTTQFAENGGNRWHGSKEEASAAALARTHECNHRKSEDTLKYQLAHARGCTREGCPLAEPVVVTEESRVMYTLLEFDHIAQEEKAACVTVFNGTARDAEREKTQVLCIWHHFEKTRSERAFRAPLGGGGSKGVVLRHKASVGCQHPVHSHMPYARLVPSIADDPLSLGFLEISHVFLGAAPTAGHSQRTEFLAKHIREGSAVVHCRFCHKLYTMCERAKLYDTPLSRHQFQSLMLQSPAFVQHFEEVTCEFDWATERSRISALKSQSAYKRKRASKAVVDVERTDDDLNTKKTDVRMSKQARVAIPAPVHACVVQ